MAIKVGINGFGRIGRICTRIMAQSPEEFEICAINLRNADIPQMAYQLKYDSTFGRFNGTVEAGKDFIKINGKKIQILSFDNPADIPWQSAGAEYIIESTGAFLTTDKAIVHKNGGAKKIILTAPPKDKVTPTFVMGVNHKKYNPKYDVVSNASCTTNCLAPLVKVIHEKFGIEEGLMSTIHASTSKQAPVDSRAGKDWRIGRSVFANIIPTTTGAAVACTKVIPELEGKLTGMAFRIPASDASVVDLTCRLTHDTTYEEICAEVKKAARGRMKGIIEYCSDPIVSKDIIGCTATCIFDESAGIMLDKHFVKLIAWYDNEFGYSTKVVELLKHVYETDTKAAAKKAAK